MYRIETSGCPKGYGYVKDYTGNKIFYGSIEQCKECISFLNNEGSPLSED